MDMAVVGEIARPGLQEADEAQEDGAAAMVFAELDEGIGGGPFPG